MSLSSNFTLPYRQGQVSVAQQYGGQFSLNPDSEAYLQFLNYKKNLQKEMTSQSVLAAELKHALEKSRLNGC